MKIFPLLALALLPVSAAAAPVSAAPLHTSPVHVVLKAAAAALPNADGFIALGSVAAITGGDQSLRARFAAVLVARAPLPGETRQLTRGDLALKLRQAGINPDTQAVLEGADRAAVTADDGPEIPPAPNNGGAVPKEAGLLGSAPTPPLLGAGGALPIVIHSGDAVTILIQSGAMTITAPAVARENGKAGDTIRVHRDGVMTDLSVQVLDAQTVQMDI